MIPISRLGRIAAILALCSLGLACQDETQSQRPQAEADHAEPGHPAPVVASVANPVVRPQEPAPLAPPVAQPPPAAAPVKAVQPKLDVLVSQRPADDPGKRLLAGYERLGKGKNTEHIEISTDRNAVEFPDSLTRAKIRGVAVAADEGAGKARAMMLELRLVDQQAKYAACTVGDGCGCEGVIPYAYVSLSHDLPAKVRVDEFKALSFWVRSKEPFQLHMVLGCYIQPRPKSTAAPLDGYLDAALTEMNPCWQSPRAELTLPDPIEILGDDIWRRYQVPIAGLKTSEPVELLGGGEMVCQLGKVTRVAFVLKKSHPLVPGEYPKDEAVIFFDDLEGLPEAATPSSAPAAGTAP